MTTLPSGLQFEDTTPGTGAEAKPGQRVKVHYTGWLYDPTAANARGKKFDSSKDRGQPFSFGLGGGEVIPVSYTHLDVYKRQDRPTPDQLIQTTGIRCVA